MAPPRSPLVYPEVVALLKAHTCLQVEHEYPGTLSVTLDDGSYVNLGTDTGDWGGTRYDGHTNDAYQDDPFDWTMPSLSPDCVDPEVIARTIAAKLGAPWIETQTMRQSAEADAHPITPGDRPLRFRRLRPPRA